MNPQLALAQLGRIRKAMLGCCEVAQPLLAVSAQAESLCHIDGGAKPPLWRSREWLDYFPLCCGS
jgi:hypothetical protein